MGGMAQGFTVLDEVGTDVPSAPFLVKETGITFRLAD